ncbi:hypothetical protein KI387_027442, partial [Taxus chinensis]
RANWLLNPYETPLKVHMPTPRTPTTPDALSARRAQDPEGQLESHHENGSSSSARPSYTPLALCGESIPSWPICMPDSSTSRAPRHLHTTRVLSMGIIR